MRGNELLDKMELVDPAYVAAADAAGKKTKNRGIWVRFGAAAACLMLIAGVILYKPLTQGEQPSGTVVHEKPSDAEGQGSVKIINKYQAELADSYAAPLPGEVSFTMEVREARKEYAGEEVRYLLAFTVFKEGGEQMTELSEQEKNAEYQRLISLGYKLYTAQYWSYVSMNEKEYGTIVVGSFTESELAGFRADPNYGYFFYFAGNGDNSGLCITEDDCITGFQTNHS